MSAEFCCGIKSSDFNCSCATFGFLMLNNRSKNGGWHLFRCLDCFILLLPMFLVFLLLLFYLKPNLEFFGLTTLNPGWQGLGFAFSEAMNLNESLYLFRDAKCPLWDEAPLPALGWPVSDPLKREGSPTRILHCCSEQEVLSAGLSSVLSSVLAVNPDYCHTDPCADACGLLLCLIKALHKSGCSWFMVCLGWLSVGGIRG